MHEISSEGWKPLHFPLGRPRLERDIFPFDVSQLPEPLPEPDPARVGDISRFIGQVADSPDFAHLCRRHARRGEEEDGNDAGPTDERPSPSHALHMVSYNSMRLGSGFPVLAAAIPIMTTGIVEAICLSAYSIPPPATITSTWRRTSSAARLENRSGLPSPPRGSVTKSSP